MIILDKWECLNCMYVYCQCKSDDWLLFHSLKSIFSCEDAALEVLMFFCLSVIKLKFYLLQQPKTFQNVDFD